MPTLSALYRYPIKSTRGDAITETTIAATGLPFDRHWMVADANGRMVTGRTDPRLVLIRAVPEGGSLYLSAPGMADLAIALSDFSTPHQASVWRDEFAAQTGSHAANDWLSTFLGHPVQLLYVGAEPQRRVRARPELPLGFADGYPLLLIGEGSLAELNRRAGQDFAMERFRPNLVIADAAPFAEDGWRQIQIGEVVLSLMKPCERCVFTTVDPQTGLKSSDQEPLRTLAQFRKTSDGVIFGQNAVAENTGLLQVGMAVRILD